MFIFVISISLGLKISAQTNTSTNTEKTIVVPEDFPIYPTSGNETTNEQNYHVAVKEWIKNHPSDYTNYVNQGVDILQFRSEYKPKNVENNTVEGGLNDQSTTITGSKVNNNRVSDPAIPYSIDPTGLDKKNIEIIPANNSSEKPE